MCDSGATNHCHRKKIKLTNVHSPSRSLSIIGVNGVPKQITTMGTLHLTTMNNNKPQPLTLHNVAHVPQSPKNIISLPKLEHKHTKIIMENGTLTIVNKQTGKTILTGFKNPKDKLYYT